jgi:hypothetical protein
MTTALIPISGMIFTSFLLQFPTLQNGH